MQGALTYSRVRSPRWGPRARGLVITDLSSHLLGWGAFAEDEGDVRPYS